MATLSQIYGTVPDNCLKDDQGVYQSGGPKIALDNTYNNGYIRRNGPRNLARVGGCDGIYDVQLPLKFVGAVPNGDPLMVEIATIAALSTADNNITSVEIDKKIIAESESIPLEELTKFVDVAMIMIDYTETTTIPYDPKCDYDLC